MQCGEQWGPYAHPYYGHSNLKGKPTGYEYEESEALEETVAGGGVEETPGTDETDDNGEAIDEESEHQLRGFNFIRKRVKGTFSTVGTTKTGFCGHIMVKGTHSALFPFHASNFLPARSHEIHEHYDLLENDTLKEADVSFFVDHFGQRDRPIAVAIKLYKPRAPGHPPTGHKNKVNTQRSSASGSASARHRN